MNRLTRQARWTRIATWSISILLVFLGASTASYARGNSAGLRRAQTEVIKARGKVNELITVVNKLSTTVETISQENRELKIQITNLSGGIPGPVGPAGQPGAPGPSGR